MTDNNKKPEAVVLNTKVPRPVALMLAKICKAKGTNIYQMLQMMCDVVMRYMSDRTNLTVEIEEMMTIFEHMDGWSKAFNLADTESDPEVAGAIYMLQDKREGHHGVVPVWVEKPFMGQWTQEMNVVQIVEKFLCHCTPTLYRRLRAAGSTMGTTTAMETILQMLSMYGNDAGEAAVREMFEDCRRSDYGRKPHEGVPFKRKQSPTVNTPGLFDHDPVSGKDIEDSLGCRPFGSEA